MDHSRNKKQATMAVAVFVKTPGYSPLKTRLAKTVGEESAHRFYRLACKTLTETIKKTIALSGGYISPYWALAERNTGDQWPDFPSLYQGDGDLGNRLHHVYSSLLSRHESAVLIGADAPHLEAEDFLQVISLHQSGHAFVVGPARDGGFYLFSGNTPVPEQVWQQTPYSSSETLGQLLPHLKELGATSCLATRTDVDTFTDLASFRHECATAKTSTANREELLSFVDSLIKSHHSE